MEGAAAAHQRLLATADAVAGLPEADAVVRRPSALPRWSVGHVLTHVARNADSHRRLITAAGRGEIGDQYPGGAEARRTEIEAGSGRAAADVVDDLRRSIWALEGAWAAAGAEAWQGSGRTVRGLVSIADLPFRRWREVEVHHADLALADLGLGITFSEWSPEYVRRELRRREMSWRSRTPMGLSGLPDAALALPPADRLAWLLGRLDVPSLGRVEEW